MIVRWDILRLLSLGAEWLTEEWIALPTPIRTLYRVIHTVTGDRWVTCAGDFVSRCRGFGRILQVFVTGCPELDGVSKGKLYVVRSPIRSHSGDTKETRWLRFPRSLKGVSIFVEKHGSDPHESGGTGRGRRRCP